MNMESRKFWYYRFEIFLVWNWEFFGLVRDFWEKFPALNEPTRIGIKVEYDD